MCIQSSIAFCVECMVEALLVYLFCSCIRRHFLLRNKHQKPRLLPRAQRVSRKDINCICVLWNTIDKILSMPYTPLSVPERET